MLWIRVDWVREVLMIGRYDEGVFGVLEGYRFGLEDARGSVSMKA